MDCGEDRAGPSHPASLSHLLLLYFICYSASFTYAIKQKNASISLKNLQYMTSDKNVPLGKRLRKRRLIANALD